MNECENITKTYQFFFAIIWAIAALASLGILSTYAVIGTAYVSDFLKVSGDSLGFAFLSVTLYGSQWVLSVYILITSLQRFASIFGEDIIKAVEWIKKFRLTRIPENKGEL